MLLHTKLHYCVLLCTFTSLGAPIARGLYVINLVGCFLDVINLVGSFNEEEDFESSLQFKDFLTLSMKGGMMNNK